MKRIATMMVTATLLTAATGCIGVNTVSSPPLAARGEVDPTSELVTISRGVAIGFECHSFWGSNCEDLVVTSADPKVARILPMHLDKYRHYDGYVNAAGSSRSTFVIAGVGAGKTLVTLISEDGDKTFEVVVVKE